MIICLRELMVSPLSAGYENFRSPSANAEFSGPARERKRDERGTFTHRASKRVTGIGPVSLAWEANVLPLYYTRTKARCALGK